MSKLNQLAGLGQAIWLDYIRRSFTEAGELGALVEQGLRGVTSNPTIFEKAIAGSADYDAALRPLVDAGKSVEEIYEALAIEDIRQAADVLRPAYDRSDGVDGYVSLEVSPTLAHETEATISEASRLFVIIDRPNVMIKIPATPAGIPAIEAAISKAINVNVTLIFSLQQYEAVAQAYLTGLKLLAASGGDISKVASVASFFISRVDSAVDRQLEALGETELQGKIAVANSKLAYARFKELFSGEEWETLAAQGARVQRPLWASTSTKNPAYPDTLYVDNLIGAHTVNTLPPATLQAFIDHGEVALSIEEGLDEARSQVERLSALGVDLDAITQKLQDDGVASFARSFHALIESVAGKRQKLLDGQSDFFVSLGGKEQAKVDAALQEIKQDQVMARIWKHDHTVWKPDPQEITNRLGWLHIAEAMKESLPRLEALAQDARAAGYTHALLLGMGGSSLAPEVFRKTFGVEAGYLDLAVLDSTNPDAVLAYAKMLDLAKTLFIVATKSGGTVETLSLFKFFYNRVLETVGAQDAGAHFVAVTDPSSRLAELAQRYNFRTTFLNDPNIGGRYSALSFFGMLPAALIGMDVSELLERALTVACDCEEPNCPAESHHSGAQLGAIMGELAKSGRDKITMITSPAISAFGDWVEQLIAESTGKEGLGILPVVGEPLGAPTVYKHDRLFAYLRLDGDTTHDAAVQALEAHGFPVIRLRLKDRYDLGAQFFLWEMSTVVAGYRLGINPFDQPNVESAKVLARQTVTAYQNEGVLPTLAPTLQDGQIGIYGSLPVDDLAGALKTFLGQAQAGAYICLQAYMQPTPESDVDLLELRTRLRDKTRMGVTVGYGPRFLHSTGQLHKGDAGRGLFIQLTADARQDAAIPDEAGSLDSSISFGVLIQAQALGDRQALLDAGREVIRFHLGADVPAGLTRLVGALD
ncbi:bifunctional transaldolase/phosoglucose isomerase [Chloroflexota bacterium]